MCVAQFDGEGPHQPDHAVLGRDVVADVRVGLEPADRDWSGRSSRRDRRPACAAPPAFTVFQTPLRLTSIISCHRCPRRHLVQLDAGGADARVGDDDVQPPELLDAAVDGGTQRVEVADVDFGGDDAPVERL